MDTTNNIGWTMLAAQYEADPVTDWNEGIQSDYDPSLVTTKGFALSQSELPFNDIFWSTARWALAKIQMPLSLSHLLTTPTPQ